MKTPADPDTRERRRHVRVLPPLGIDPGNVPHRADVARLLDERHFRVFG